MELRCAHLLRTAVEDMKIVCIVVITFTICHIRFNESSSKPLISWNGRSKKRKMFVCAAGRHPSKSGVSLCCVPLSKVAKNCWVACVTSSRYWLIVGTRHRTFVEIGGPCSIGVGFPSRTEEVPEIDDKACMLALPFAVSLRNLMVEEELFLLSSDMEVDTFLKHSASASAACTLGMGHLLRRVQLPSSMHNEKP